MVEAESTRDEPRACQSAPHPVASSDTAQRAGRVPSRLAHEVEVGNVEYKLKLIEPSAARFEQLVTQLKYRLDEGSGRALYEIGVEDDGALTGIACAEMDASLRTLERMAAKLKKAQARKFVKKIAAL